MDATEDTLDAAAQELEACGSLVERAQGGERAAFDELVRYYEPRLRRIASIGLGHELRRFLDSVDVVQDTLLLACQDIRKLDAGAEGGVLRWLAAIALNRIRNAHDHHFAQKRDPAREVRAGAAGRALQELAAADTPIPDRAWEEERRGIVDLALAQLPPQFRDAIVLRDYCGASWEEVAAALARPTPAAARQLHRRALLRLAERIGDRIGDEPHTA